MLRSTVTDKGQTTIPQKVREALKVKARQRLDWEIQNNGTAVVRRGRSALDLFGSLKPAKAFAGLKEEKAAVRRAIAEKVGKEGTGGNGNSPRR